MSKDPRVLFGLCKVTVASPPLVVYDDAVDSQLEEVIRSHCSREVVRARARVVFARARVRMCACAGVRVSAQLRVVCVCLCS